MEELFFRRVSCANQIPNYGKNVSAAGAESRACGDGEKSFKCQAHAFLKRGQGLFHFFPLSCPTRARGRIYRP